MKLALLSQILGFYCILPAVNSERDIIECGKLPNQREISLHKITKRWYAIELIEHHREDVRSSKMYKCIVIDVIENRNRMNLIWQEEEFRLNYTFVVSNSSPGHWESQGSQQVYGDLGLSYEQFAGSVSIIKAVKDQLVLTFCSLHSKLYTLILSDKPKMSEKELSNIHEIIHSVHLPMKSINKYICSSARALTTESNFVLLAIVAFYSVKKFLFNHD